MDTKTRIFLNSFIGIFALEDIIAFGGLQSSRVKKEYYNPPIILNNNTNTMPWKYD
jgi:hypothetical protein